MPHEAVCQAPADGVEPGATAALQPDLHARRVGAEEAGQDRVPPPDEEQEGWEFNRSDAEFARLEANPDIGRDFLGEGGSVRLFLSKGDYIVAGSELNDEASYIAQSEAVKHAKPEVAAAMRQSIGHDHKYLTDGFFDPIGGRSFSNSSANQVASTFTQPAPQAETPPPPAKLGRKGRHATGSSAATSALNTGDEQEAGADDTKKDRDVGSDRNRAVGSARKDQKFMIEALTTNLAGAAATLQNPELDAQDELYTNELKVRMELGDLLLNQKWDGTKAYEDQDVLEKAIADKIASFSIPPAQDPANLISLRAVENNIKNITSANCEDSLKKAVAEGQRPKPRPNPRPRRTRAQTSSSCLLRRSRGRGWTQTRRRRHCRRQLAFCGPQFRRLWGLDVEGDRRV